MTTKKTSDKEKLMTTKKTIVASRSPDVQYACSAAADAIRNLATKLSAAKLQFQCYSSHCYIQLHVNSM